MKKIFFSTPLIFFCFILTAQVPVGGWTDYFSYNNVTDITASDDFIYAATDGGIFTIDKETFEISKISKVNGLSDFGISKISYNKDNRFLIIVYENANIDIIKENQIINIPDIKLKQLQGNTATNYITFLDEFAFLSTGFGIVKLNTETFEIESTYYIGENASQIEIFQLLYDNQFFYAATEAGIYKAEINNPNLADYNNWQRIETIPNYNKKFSSFVIRDNKWFVIYNDESNDKASLLMFDTAWTSINSDLYENTKIFFSSDNFALTGYNSVSFYNYSGFKTRSIWHYDDNTVSISPQNVFFDNENILIGDKTEGLVIEDKDRKYSINYPDGPASNNAYGITITENSVFLTGGGKENNTDINLWNEGLLYVYTDNIWNNITYDDGRDFICITSDPSENDKVFVGSWGKGVFEIKNNEILNIYNSENSTLQSIIENPEYIRISAIVFDNENNMWTFNSAVNPVNVRTNEGEWVSFDFDNQISELFTGDMIIDQNSTKWSVLRKGNGIFAFNENNSLSDFSDDEFKKFYPKDEEGTEIGSEVNALACDNEGNIWIGTDDGVGVAFNPDDFYETDFYVTRIKYTAQIEDTIITNYLLKGKNIKSIAVDGANRKWFGTERNGVFLMSPEGTKEILNFNTVNSPLPSNNIIGIIINHKSGEVYFLTTKGLISYRAEATKGNTEFKDVYVFPNPVKENYDGLITITGLVDNVNVKITDIAGNIVFETTALGGQAVWDGNNFSGRRVSTGIYLVFSSNEDGSKTNVTKLLFIN